MFKTRALASMISKIKTQIQKAKLFAGEIFERSLNRIYLKLSNLVHNKIIQRALKNMP
jgi:hypothetical protein